MLKRNMISAAGCLLLFAATLFTGCSGGGGGDSAPAPTPSKPVVDAASMSNDTLSKLSFEASDIKVAINSPPVVTFKLLTTDGNPIKGMGVKASSTATTLNYLRFTIAKLVPATNGGPDQWINYMVTATSRPTTESVPANLVDNGDGSYTYTFAKDITDPAQTGGVTYEPTKTHRLAIQLSGNIPGTTVALKNPANIIYDWIPAGGTVTKKEVTSMAACNECHGDYFKTSPHAGRVDPRYCVVCHTDQRKIGRTNSASSGGAFTGTTYVADGEVQGDFAVMVHKIHMGNRLTKTGYDYAGVKYNDIGYSMIGTPNGEAQQKNCLKCHTKTDAAPQGDNWKAKPSRMACGSCHDNLNFATGANSKAGKPVHIIQTSDANCATCHTEAKVTEYHSTQFYSPFSPAQKAGLADFAFEIKDVSVNSTNQPVVTFRVMKGRGNSFTTPVNFSSFTGFTNSISFIVAYSMAQDGIAEPNDFNNLGKAAGQPASVTLANLLAAGSAGNANGSLTGPDASGYYTAVLNGGAANAARFPAGATMRTVLMQGNVTQSAGTEGISASSVRYVKGVSKTATGDTPRRTIVDNEKCFKCHDMLVFHGGSRTYNTQLCVVCHNPNLSSSGRGANVANLTAAERAKMVASGVDPDNPAAYPEASNNLKDMLHGIHAGSMRKAEGNPYMFVRDRGTSGVYFYDWSKVKFPSVLKNCESCHVPGTYNSTPSNALLSTSVTLGSGTVAQNRASMPNATDLAIPAYTASCLSCHGSSNAGNHSISMGGVTLAGTARSAAKADSCAACHSSGKTVDAATVHKK